MIGRKHAANIRAVTLDVPDRDRRAAGHDCPIWDIGVYKAVCPDDAPGSNAGAGNDNGLATDIRTIADADRRPPSCYLTHRHASKSRVVGEDVHPRGDIAEVPDGQFRSRTVKDHEGPDPGLLPDSDAAEGVGGIVHTGTFAEPELVGPLPTIEKDVREWQAPIPPAAQFLVSLCPEGP